MIHHRPAHIPLHRLLHCIEPSSQKKNPHRSCKCHRSRWIPAQWTAGDILCCMRILSFHERQNQRPLRLTRCICMRRRGEIKPLFFCLLQQTHSGSQSTNFHRHKVSSDLSPAGSFSCGLLPLFCVLIQPPLTTGEEEKGKCMKSSRLWPCTFSKMPLPSSKKLKMWDLVHYR